MLFTSAATVQGFNARMLLGVLSGLDDKASWPCPLLFLEAKSGSSVLKPMKAKPEMDLVDHLLRFKGVNIPERQHFCPPRV